MELRIPKLRQGNYFPGLLEPRKKAEQALAGVLQEAYVLGVSTRKVDELVKSMGMNGVSKSEVSRFLLGAGRSGCHLPKSPAGCSLSLPLA